jgi:hypothetical protein
MSQPENTYLDKLQVQKTVAQIISGGNRLTRITQLNEMLILNTLIPIFPDRIAH